MSTPVYAIAFHPCARQWLQCTSPERVYAAHSVAEVSHALEEVERACTTEGRLAVGWVSYEAAPAFDPALFVREEGLFPKVWFATFGSPTPLETLPDSVPLEPLSWSSSVTREEYVRGSGVFRMALRSGSRVVDARAG